MIEALRADGPAQEIAEEMMLFGQFVGAWDVVVATKGNTGEIAELTGEWSFGWALSGRAIVDVWKVPGREHGVAVRYYDARIRAWRVSWSGPQTARQILFLAGQVGDEIVLEGEEDGRPVRWIFSEIGANSFRWRAVSSWDEGATWNLTQEMRATRQPQERVARSHVAAHVVREVK